MTGAEGDDPEAAFVTLLWTASGQPANKRITLVDGKPTKRAHGDRGTYFGQVVRADDPNALAAVLREAGDRPDALLSLGYVPAMAPQAGEERGQRFRIISRAEAARRLGLAATAPTDQIDSAFAAEARVISGDPVVTRTRGFWRFGGWMLFDRDPSPDMPDDIRHAVADDAAWLETMERVAPGISAAGRVRLRSSTGRVRWNGEPLPASGRHEYIRLDRRNAVGTVALGLQIAAVLAGLSWRKAARSTATGDVVSTTMQPVWDPAVFSPERLVFVGAPDITGAGLTLDPPVVEAFSGAAYAVAAVPEHDDTARAEASARAGASFPKRRASPSATAADDADGAFNGPVLTAADLTLDTVIAFQRHGKMTVRAAIKRGLADERAQVPEEFRSSESFNAMYWRNRDGSPVLWDRGARVRHVLADSRRETWDPIEPHFPAPTSTRPEAIAALKRETEQFFDDAVRNSKARREWKARLAEIEEAHEVGSRERRVALRDGRRAMVAAHGAGWRAPGRRAVAQAAAGIGKSTLVAACITQRRADLGNVGYLTDSTKNAEAIAAQIPDAVVVLGRGKPDPDRTDGATMCLRPAAAERVAQAGLPVGQTLCSDSKGNVCKFFSECGWQEQKRRNLSGEITVFAGSHNYGTHHGPMPALDSVVIDENCVNPLIGHIEFGFDRLLPTETAGYRGGNLGAAMGYRDIMAKVCNALRDPAGALAGLRSQGITDAAGLGAAVAYLRAVEEGEFTGDLSPDMSDELVIEQLDRHERSEIGLILKLLTALQEEISLPRDHAHGVAYHPNKAVRINGRTEFQNRVSVHYRKTLSFAKDVPVLLLDASGDAEIYRRLFGDRLENMQSVKCDRNMEVVQIRDVTMAKSSLMGVDRYGNALSDKSASKAAQLRGELTNAANALAQKHGPFFAASYKKVVEEMRPALSDAVLTGHFGNLRGSNEFENCTAGMIIGRHQVPVEVVEADARALWSDDPEPLNLPGKYIKATRGIRMRDGSGVSVDVDVHPDPRVQRVLELYREREAEQGGDRLRAIHNPEAKLLYVVCNLPLDMTVDRVITKAQFMHEATGAIDNGKTGTARRTYGNRLVEAFRRTGGLLPTNRRELWRLAQNKTSVLNGLWDSERAIKDDLDSNSLQELIGWSRQDSILLAKSTQLEPVTITYRHAGPGPSSVALVAIPGEAGKLALERLLGRPIISYVSDAPAPEAVPTVEVVVNKLPPWQLPATRPAMPARPLDPMPWQRNAPAVSVVIPGVTFTVTGRMHLAPFPVSATVGHEIFTEHQANSQFGKGAAS